MKNTPKYALLLGTALLALSSCREDYDMSGIFEPDDVYAQAYVYTKGPAKKSYNYEFKAVIDETGKKTYAFLSDVDASPVIVPAQVTRPVDTDLKVSFEIAPELLDRYNEENGTDYTLLETARFEKLDLTIPRGGYRSSDSLRLNYDETEFFDMQGHYAVPVRLASAEGAAVSSNFNEFILFFNAKYNTSAVAWSGTDTHTFKLMFDRGDGTHFNAVGSLDIPVALASQYEALEDTKVSVRINNDLITAYNQAHQTAYASVPNVKLAGGSEFTIKTGEASAAGDVTLSFPDNMASLEMGRDYIIPLEITETSGYGSGVSQTGSVFYVLIPTLYAPNMAAATAPTGTALDRSAISVQYNSGSSYWYDCSAAFRGTGYGAQYMYSYYSYKIDLGAVHTLKSIEFNSYYYSYYDYYYAPQYLNIAVSLDGETWDDWGDSEDLPDGQQAFISIRFPAAARYLMLKAPKSWHSSYVVLDGKVGMNFYE